MCWWKLNPARVGCVGHQGPAHAGGDTEHGDEGAVEASEAVRGAVAEEGSAEDGVCRAGDRGQAVRELREGTILRNRGGKWKLSHTILGSKEVGRKESDWAESDCECGQ